MNSPEKNTEELILEAANKVFLEKGYDGSRMQEIAETAGINKALLHYYYRSKDRLFESIFRTAFKLIQPKLNEIFSTPAPFEERIRKFTDTYLGFLIKNPMLPGFVIHELNRKSPILEKIFEEINFKPEMLDEIIAEEVKAGRIKPTDPRQLIVNILSMCIFPIVAKPILMVVLFGNDEKAYKKFLEQRKSEIPNFIMDSIRTK